MGKELSLLRRADPEDVSAIPLDFHWPSAAIVNAETPPLARNIVWIVASMVAAGVGAMAVIPVDQVVSTRGVVVSHTSTVVVQPLETSIVRAIKVHEGQTVKAGDVLARLDPTFAASDAKALAAQVASGEAEVARLEAEADEKPFKYSGFDPRWALQAGIYSHRRAEFVAKLEHYKQKIAEAGAVVARSEADAAGYRQRLGVAQNIEQARRKLEAMKYGSRMETWMATDNRAEMERSLANALQTADGARREQAALTAERDSFTRGWQAEISQKLSEARSRASNAREEHNKAKLRSQLTDLRSDVDAVVQSVEKVSVGSVLQSGERLITLVPVSAKLEVETNISGRDSGYVHAHDPVIIKFDTFPFSRFGVAEGNVQFVSPDSFTQQTEARNPTGASPLPSSSEQQHFYRSRIEIEKVALHGVPPDFHVMPGMPVTADIKVGKRTVLQYLAGLVLPVAQEGMREP
ncbi:HlyD family type I secretion periplasmic adaptor subunit [Methylocystis parvus]|uniref:HlyD family type I secretion periplasmic adaptor subunit n=1 Tax=Methylocystis parvus TaxID=134 RepID=UPI003C755602